MSLHYIIDGYNILHHPNLAPANKEIHNPKAALLEFIKANRLTGSLKNKISLVFDGYPDASGKNGNNADIEIIFSRHESADERIKRMVENSSSRKNIIAVSDDKEIRFCVKAAGAACLSVEEFTHLKVRPSHLQKTDTRKTELSYSQIQKINQEFKKIWLK
jgi:predicted RNA-binding protein with PIN domain